MAEIAVELGDWNSAERHGDRRRLELLGETAARSRAIQANLAYREALENDDRRGPRLQAVADG